MKSRGLWLHRHLTTALVSLLFLPLPFVKADPMEASQRAGFHLPAIGIIIDDLGYNLPRGRRALRLQGPLALSLLPHTPFASHLARLAHRRHKEVLLHLPMEPRGHEDMGPGGLTLGMGHDEFLAAVRDDMRAIPGFIGVNNHMGSLLTTSSTHMQWLMAAIRDQQGLFFVDSLTTANSVAAETAQRSDVPHLKRDVFLDNERNLAAIEGQFAHLLHVARHQGGALAIGHPYPETFEVLEYWLPRLRSLGVQLVAVSDLVHLKRRRLHTWQASLSPSPPDAKSLKPSP